MTESQPKLALCVAHVQPSPGGSGGKIGFFGNVAALHAYGYEVHCAVFSDPEPPDQPDYPVTFLGPLTSDGQKPNPNFDTLLAELKPAIVWLHEAKVWAPFAAYSHAYPHALLCGDPEWQIRQERRRFHEPTPSLLRRLLKTYRWKNELATLKKEEKQVATAASRRGVLAAWSPADAPGIRARTGLKPAVCSLVFPDWGMRPTAPDQQDPELLLLGGFNGVHTRDGLRYFFDEIWPVWEKHPNRPEATIRVIGAGNLPDHFARPAESDKFQWIGFAPDILAEWQRGIALLVPVTLTLGFRTRIVEAWSRGVPVIAHPSARVGLPMMQDGQNYLKAVTATEWIEAAHRVVSDVGLREQLIRNGRQTFLDHLSIDIGKIWFGELADAAIERFARKP